MSAHTAQVDGADYTIADPSADSREFRRALGQYGTGVAVVTTIVDGEPTGMTVNSFAAVSLTPPLVLWSIRSDSSRATQYTEAEHFAINVLASDQVPVSRAFASAGSGADAFSAIPWSRGVQGAPLVDGALARLECRAHAVYPAGDHHIIIGEVARCSTTSGESLLFAQGGYAVPTELLEARPPAGPVLPEASQEAFSVLLTAASHRLSQEFDEHRAGFGLTVATGRVLRHLSVAPSDLARLTESTYLGPRTVEDALSFLLEEGLVRTLDGVGFELTAAGRALREQVAGSAREFTDEALADLPAADVTATRRVLDALLRR